MKQKDIDLIVHLCDEIRRYPDFRDTSLDLIVSICKLNKID